jgi:hypothetical protein
MAFSILPEVKAFFNIYIIKGNSQVGNKKDEAMADGSNFTVASSHES